MKEFILVLLVFVVVYLFYFSFVILSKKQMKKFDNNTYVKFLINNFKLDKDKLNMKSLAHIIAISNSLIIALTFAVTEITENFIFKMLLGFATLLLLELLIYYIVGKILKRKSGKNV